MKQSQPILILLVVISVGASLFLGGIVPEPATAIQPIGSSDTAVASDVEPIVTSGRTVMIGEDILIDIKTSEAREVGVQLRTAEGEPVVGTELELDAGETGQVRFSTQSFRFDTFGGPGEYTVTVKDPATGRFLGATPLLTVVEFGSDDMTTPAEGTSSQRQVLTPSTAEGTAQQGAMSLGKSSPQPSLPFIRFIAPGAVGLMIGFLLGNTDSVEIKTNALTIFVGFFGVSGLVAWNQLGINAGLVVATGAIAVIIGTVVGGVVSKAGLEI